jgi:hypothetical protein
MLVGEVNVTVPGDDGGGMSTRMEVDPRAQWWLRLDERARCCLIVEGLHARHEASVEANRDEPLPGHAVPPGCLPEYHRCMMAIGKTLAFFKPQTLTALYVPFTMLWA